MPSASSSSPQLGVVFDQRYRVLRKLEAGGMGTVYEAEQIRLGKRVAIKVLRREVTGNEVALRRFEREARLASRIRHRNVVELVDFGVENDTAYYVMELLEGRNLAVLLETQGALPWRRARSILLQIARALGAAHRLGIIHRDVKPANCFLLDPEDEDEGDLVKVLDFGIAKLANTFDASGQLTKTTELLGTVAYMSPEQAQSQPIDARSDVYSLGVLVYQVLTGRLPFNDDNAFNVLLKHVREPPRPPRELVPGIPEPVQAAILRALAKAPEDRFEDMDAFKAALAEVSATALGGPHPAAPSRSHETGSLTIPRPLLPRPDASTDTSTEDTVVLGEPQAPPATDEPSEETVVDGGGAGIPEEFLLASDKTELVAGTLDADDEAPPASTLDAGSLDPDDETTVTVGSLADDGIPPAAGPLDPDDETTVTVGALDAVDKTEIAAAPGSSDDPYPPAPANSTVPVLSEVMRAQRSFATAQPGGTAPGIQSVPAPSGDTAPGTQGAHPPPRGPASGAHAPSGGMISGTSGPTAAGAGVVASGAQPISGAVPAIRLERTLPYEGMSATPMPADDPAGQQRLVKLAVIGGVLALLLGAMIAVWVTAGGEDSGADAPGSANGAAPEPVNSAAPAVSSSSAPGTEPGLPSDMEPSSPSGTEPSPTTPDPEPAGAPEAAEPPQSADAGGSSEPDAPEETATPENSSPAGSSPKRTPPKRRTQTDASVKSKLQRKASKACGDLGSGTTVRVSLSIDPAGALTLARTEAPHQSSALGKCVRAAMEGAQFPATGDRRALSLRVDL